MKHKHCRENMEITKQFNFGNQRIVIFRCIIYKTKIRYKKNG